MSLPFTPWFSSFPLLYALCPSPPPSCCEAPHSFPHSHFHFPALGFASTLSSTSFAQMTSDKTNRDVPIRLYSWCRKEAVRDRGFLCLLLVSGICHWSGDTQFALGRFSVRLNPSVSLQKVIGFCSHRRCHVDAYSHGHNLIRAFGCLTPACVREALQASQHSALLWIPQPLDAERVPELSQTGLG